MYIYAILFMSKKNIQEMALNFPYIESKYGKKVLKKLKKAIEIRKTLHYSHRDTVIVKDPKYRSIVCSNVINVPSYQYSLIEKVALFFEYNGDTQKMALNSEYSLNAIVASLNDGCLEDILIESVYKKLKKLLELDSILTQNKLIERNELIKKVVLVSYGVNGDSESLTEILGYPIGAIERILSNPYVSFVCDSLKIDNSVIEIKYNDNVLETQKVKVDCALTSPGIWAAEETYIFPGNGKETTFSILFKMVDGTEVTYGYTYKGVPEANKPFNVTGSYSDGVIVGGNFEVNDWEDAVDVEFEFGATVEPDKEDEEEDSDTPVEDIPTTDLVGVPEVGTIWNDMIVADINESVEGEMELLLMSLEEWKLLFLRLMK